MINTTSQRSGLHCCEKRTVNGGMTGPELMNEMADFVVVGAGVYGAGVALHLAEAGADVVVLDSREVATQASGGPGRRGVRAMVAMYANCR